MTRRQNDRVGDEAILVPLDGTDHGSLRLGRLVVMNNADTPEELQRIINHNVGIFKTRPRHIPP